MSHLARAIWHEPSGTIPAHRPRDQIPANYTDENYPLGGKNKM
jgi:hypothetical protein